MVRVGINAHLLSGQTGYRQAGIHHYIKQLLNHLPISDDLQYFVFTSRGGKDHLDIGRIPRETRLNTENPLTRIIWEQLVWPIESAYSRLDMLHSMAFVTPLWRTVSKTIVTVFDLSFIHHPERYSPLKRLYLQTQTRRSCRQATTVIAISESGRQDIHKLFGVPLERIEVVYPGVDPIFQPASAEAIAQFKKEKQLDRPYILHVGTLQPRKNIPMLIEAFAQLRHPSMELILVGGKGWLYDEIYARVEQHGLKNHVRFMGYVPDTELPLWYNGATALVFPSVYEGFGMPVTQAMACGTPVITSNTSSLPEVVGNAGMMFNPHDSAELVSCLDRIINDSQFASQLKTQGFEQVRQFSWTHSGTKMAQCYRQMSQTPKW